MRDVVGFVLGLVLVGLPLGVSAQTGDDGAAPEPNVEEPTPPSEAAPEEPVLRLDLNDDSVQLAPGSFWADEELEEMELRVKKARIGIGVSACAFVVGSGVNYGGLAAGYSSNTEALSVAAVILGSVLAVGGLAGMIASGVLLHRRKRDRDSLRAAHTGTPRRVQWDPARSRLVF